MSPPLPPVTDDPLVARLRARLEALRHVADSAFADSVSTGRRGVARTLDELGLNAAQQGKYEQLLGQRWAHDDAVDELAADEWDLLVAGGMARGEATRQVARKYHQ